MSRVLLISDIFPPDIGGPATYTDHLAHKLAARGHSVRVVCSSDSATHLSDAQRRFAVHRVSRASRYRYEIEIRARIAQGMVWADHVYVGNLERYVDPIARALRQPVVTKVVGDVVWETLRNRGLTTATFEEFQRERPTDTLASDLAAARLRQLSACRLVITPSEYMRSVVVGWGVPADRVAFVHNGVDLDVAASNPPHRGDGRFVLGFIGRLTNWKGVETLLCAVRSLPDTKVVVVGDGPEFPILANLAQQLGVADRVDFRGKLGAEQVRAELGGFHALVLGSAYEGLSHTLLEAASMGVPAIASDCCGNPEVITDGVDGRLVPYADVDALVAAITELRDDDALRLRLSEASRANAERFSFDATVRRTIELLGL